MMRIPADESRKASVPPTFPKPCSTARLPTNGTSKAAKAARTQVTTPDAVAPAWAGVPPRARGLPVTDPPTSIPCTFSMVSMSQAITRPSVFTSGAGMSRSGPSKGMISSV